ncbi:MAG TPA: hypothetical protein VKT33_15215 [Candidatus Angelobacter sp.]|nr:hypothetical protein [Candidatus Angelobacter sp.]
MISDRRFAYFEAAASESFVISRRLIVALFIFILFLTSALTAVDGAFQGRIADPPPGAKPSPGWIFVQGHNHIARRVDVTHARVVMAEDASAGNRCHDGGVACLTVGTEVRITASQDSAGEWHARVIEILELAKGLQNSTEREFTER